MIEIGLMWNLGGIRLASAHCYLEMISAAGLLANRKTYPERPKRIELVETPYSWVYFSDRHVHKQKKPV